MRPVDIGRWVLALGFVGAGGLHVVAPAMYDPAMPPWVPLPRAMILISGVAEVAGGVGLMQRSPRLRRWAGWGLVALLVAVSPANVWMALAESGGSESDDGMLRPWSKRSSPSHSA